MGSPFCLAWGFLEKNVISLFSTLMLIFLALLVSSMLHACIPGLSCVSSVQVFKSVSAHRDVASSAKSAALMSSGMMLANPLM